MALHRFMSIEMGVPDPDALAGFCSDIGLIGEESSWGTADVPDQVRITEAPYRQLRTMGLGCESEEDLVGLQARLTALGVDSERRGDLVSCVDPTGDWTVTVEVAPDAPLREQASRAWNRPGERARSAARADVVTETAPRPPRRLGHAVVGSPDPAATVKFFREGIGFRLSDEIPGFGAFLRCSTDHHNLLVQPGPIPYLNHYALEFDDIDAVGAAARRYLEAHAERHVVGLGRHVIGSNVFWYMNDPCGTMFECFSDMDDIPDDDEWTPRTDWGLDQFSEWGPKEPPLEFAFPADLDAIAKTREAEGK